MAPFDWAAPTGRTRPPGAFRARRETAPSRSRLGHGRGAERTAGTEPLDNGGAVKGGPAATVASAPGRAGRRVERHISRGPLVRYRGHAPGNRMATPGHSWAAQGRGQATPAAAMPLGLEGSAVMQRHWCSLVGVCIAPWWLLAGGFLSPAAPAQDADSSAAGPAAEPAAVAPAPSEPPWADDDVVFYDYLENGELRGGMTTREAHAQDSCPDGTFVPEWGATTVLYSGRSSNRVDFVLLGDGYTFPELPTYIARVGSLNGIPFQKKL